jgi:hypothetical protein
MISGWRPTLKSVIWAMTIAAVVALGQVFFGAADQGWLFASATISGSMAALAIGSWLVDGTNRRPAH